MTVTIEKKLWSMTLMMILFIVVVGISAYVNVKQIDQALHKIIDDEMIQRESSYEMEIQINRIGVGVLGFLLDEGAEHLDRIKNGRTDFSAAWERYQKLCTTNRGKVLGQKVKAEFDQISALINDLLEEKKRQSQLLLQLFNDYASIDTMINDDIQAAIQKNDPKYLQKMESSMAMEISINGVIKGLNGFLNSHDGKYLDTLHRDINNFTTFLHTYLSANLSINETNRVREIQTLFETNAPRIEQSIAIEKKETDELAAFILQRRAVQSLLADEIRALTAGDLKSAGNNSIKAVQTTVIVVIVLTLCGLLLGGLSSYFITRSISGPLEKLSKWADQIAARDFAHVEIKTSNDEIGHLNTCFKQMAADLRVFNEQTNIAVQNINTTATEILAAIQQQSSSIKEQAAAVQQTSTTMEEIRETGSQVSGKAKDVAQAAEATNTASEAGIQAVEEAHAIMESIRAQVEEVAQNIVSLSEKTQAIGDIIATVNDIAEQSNLLAINAAIEAVGAGEQGQRFSVVANEIKNLADQAKTSTIEVRSILSEIQGGISTSVMSTEEAVKRVETGRSKSEIAAETIRQLTDTTTESIQAFQQIVAGAGQQQIGLDQVTQALKDIEQGTEQTSSGINQIETAVANLNDLSSKLKNMVEGEDV